MYVVDRDMPGVAELDLVTGRVLRSYSPDQPPGRIPFRRPSAIAVSPDGRFIAVYDGGLEKSSVFVLTPKGELLNRLEVTYFYNTKGFAIGNDTSIVIGGGRIAPDRTISSMTWLRHGTVQSLGPVLAPRADLEPEQRRDAPIYLAGGAILLVGDSAFMADDATSGLWAGSSLSVQRIADGPPSPPNLESRALRRLIIPGQTRPAYNVTRDWPMAKVIDTIPGGFLTVWRMSDAGPISIYRLAAGQPPLELASYQLDVDEIVRDRADTFVTVKRYDDGTWTLSRIRMPFSLLH